MKNVEVKKAGNENPLSLIRRFSRKVKNSGILPRLRSIRYNNRSISDNVKKKHTLKKIEKREEIDKLIKLGKIKPKYKGRGRRN